MKKFVSFILILSIIFSCFNYHIGAQNVIQNVIIFETAVPDNVMVEGTNTIISYDHISDAMRVSAVTDGLYCNKIQIDFSDFSIEAADYPVFAMRIKLSRTDITFGKFYWSTESKRADNGSWFVSSNAVNPEYVNTIDWQVLVFNLKEYQSEYLSGDYISIILALQPELYNCKATDILISGMGFFESEETANEYFYKRNGDVGTDSRAVRLDYADSVSRVTAVEGNTEVFFNTEFKTIGVRELNVGSASPSKIVVDFDGNTSVEKYPILALHVKLRDIKTEFGLVGVKSIGWLEALNSGNVSTQYASSKTLKPQYEPIMAWQWVFFDIRTLSSEYLSGNILSLIVAFQNESTSAEQVTDVYVDAVGFLESEDEVLSVFGSLNQCSSNIFVPAKAECDILATADENTKLKFNEASGSITVSSETQGTRRNVLRILPESSIEAADYPVFAMRLRLSRENVRFGKFYWRTEGKRDADNGWFVSSPSVNPVFKETCEWQTVVFDLRSQGSEYLHGDYLELLIAFQSETQVCSAADIEISSMGMFASAEQAQEHFLASFGALKEFDNVFCDEEIINDEQLLTVSVSNKPTAYIYDTVAVHISSDNSVETVESVVLKTDSSEYEKKYIAINSVNGQFEWIYLDFSQLLPVGNIVSIELSLSSGTTVDGIALFRNETQGQKAVGQREKLLASAVEVCQFSLESDRYTVVSKSRLETALSDANELLLQYGTMPEYIFPFTAYDDFDAIYTELVNCYAELEYVSFGDANSDGSIDIRDIIRMKKYMSDKAEINTIGGDSDDDGRIGISDLILLRKYLMGVTNNMGIYDFPVESAISAQEFAEKITNQNVLTVGKVESQRNVIYPFDRNYAFSHNPHIIYFNGRFIAMWTAGRENEDDLGQSVHFSTSDDAEKWSVPQPLYVSKKGIYSETIAAAANFYISNNTLYAYFSVLEIKPEYLRSNGTLRPEGDCTGEMILWSQNYYVSTTDGLNWSEPQQTGACSSTQNVFCASNGREFMFIGASCRYNDTGSPNGWKITGANVQSAYDKGVGLVCEACGYMTDDRILRMLTRTDTGYLFYAESLDNGLTWSDLYPTNFAVESSMCNAGRLPDGRYYIIANSEIKKTWDRIPLYIYVSEDGFNFNKRYIIRDETDYQLQQNGIAKGGNYAYPTTLIKDGYMYIIYSKQKEIIEVTKFDLSQIA